MHRYYISPPIADYSKCYLQIPILRIKLIISQLSTLNVHIMTINIEHETADISKHFLNTELTFIAFSRRLLIDRIA